MHMLTGNALVDLLTLPDEKPPEPHKRVLVRHPFQVGVFVSQSYLLRILRATQGPDLFQVVILDLKKS